MLAFVLVIVIPFSILFLYTAYTSVTDMNRAKARSAMAQAPQPAPAQGAAEGSVPNPASGAPIYGIGMKTNFSMVKIVLLSLVTLGIYGIWAYAKMGEYLNTMAERYDGRHTMSYWLMFFLVGPITLEIGTLVWFHNFSARVGQEAARRNLPYDFGASTYWLWSVLGSLILVGPWVYLHKLCKVMNALTENYQHVG